MNVTIGNYEVECDIDPTVQNNASDEKIEIKDIGFIYNCIFKQKNALVHSVEAVQKIYPDSKIYLVSDGGLDYSFLECENIKFSMQEDTVSPIKKINESNFLEPEHQAVTKKGMVATIRRLKEGLEFCDYPEWFCMTEPDVLIRGKISYPKNAKLLGTRLNHAWYLNSWIDGFMGINNLISQVEGTVPVFRWGAVPVIGHTQTLLKGIDVYLNNFEIFDKLSEQFHVPGTFDLFLPILFALAGEPEVFSDEYTECMRNPNWKDSDHPVVHQYREYYDQKDFYGVAV
jgi:hypothetical protein